MLPGTVRSHVYHAVEGDAKRRLAPVLPALVKGLREGAATKSQAESAVADYLDAMQGLFDPEGEYAQTAAQLIDRLYP